MPRSAERDMVRVRNTVTHHLLRGFLFSILHLFTDDLCKIIYIIKCLLNTYYGKKLHSLVFKNRIQMPGFKFLFCHS